MTYILRGYLNQLTENLTTTLSTPEAYLNRIALTTLTVIFALLINMMFKNIFTRNIKSEDKKLRLHKLIKTTAITLTIIVTLFIWIQAINAFVLIALLFGGVVFVMVKGLTQNITAYVFIKYKNYFEVGQRVEINGIVGDVIDINPIHFTLLEVKNWLSSNSNTGRFIQVPNSIIFDESLEIIGLERIFIWEEIKYTLSFDSKWQDAEIIMNDIVTLYFINDVEPRLEDGNAYLMGTEEHLEPVFSLRTNDLGIIVNMRYLIDYRNGTSVRTELQRMILTEFDANPEIKFAVSDIRILDK